MIRIVLTGGGTGGHLFPLVAVSRKINDICRTENLGEPEIYYLGPGLFLEKQFGKRSNEFSFCNFNDRQMAALFFF